jgi:beta-galactosidase
VLHIFPHWNLQGHEGEEIELWAYSNCDEVELIVNGKKAGRQTMPKNGHLKWKAVYQPGKVVAIGYKGGKRIMTQTIETTKPAYKTVLKADRRALKADGRDVAVITVEVQDQKDRLVPDACPVLSFRLEGAGRILGAGNGDPMYLGEDHPKENDCRAFSIPAFNGLAQVLIQSSETPSPLVLSCESEGLKTGILSVTTGQ